MNIGKIPENALKRSVLGQLGTKQKEVISGAGTGSDCAVLSMAGDGAMMSCVQEAVIMMENSAADRTAARAGTSAERGMWEAFMTMGELIQKCANNLAAGGALPVAVMIVLFLPEEGEEALLRELMEAAGKKCAELSLEIAGGQSRVTGAVTAPVAVVTGYGIAMVSKRNRDTAAPERVVSGRNVAEKAETGNGMPGKAESEKEMPEKAKAGNGMPEKAETGNEASGKAVYGSRELGKAAPGQDVVLSKWIGLQGTAVLAMRNRERLLGRYPACLVETAAGFGRYLSVLPEAEIAVKHGVCAMHDASEGGILGALWELAEGAGVGLTVDMRKLPLRQETVEVCECCNVNPYELMSGGCLIMTSRDGPELAAALEAAGIPAAVVGKVTDSNDRILINGDEIRYMNRPGRDGIYAGMSENVSH